MNSMTFILWSGLGVIGLFLFAKYRVSTIESNLLDKIEARKVGIDFIREFVGIDVEAWEVYSESVKPGSGSCLDQTEQFPQSVSEGFGNGIG